MTGPHCIHRRHQSLPIARACAVHGIKFGDASPVVMEMRDNIVFDEFEWDQTSVRKTWSHIRTMVACQCSHNHIV